MHLSPMVQDTLFLFSFYMIVVTVTEAIASLVVKLLEKLFTR